MHLLNLRFYLFHLLICLAGLLSGLDIKNPRFLYLLLQDKDSSGWMYGYILYRKGDGNTKDYSIIFWYNPLTRTTQNVEVDGAVRQVVLSEGDLYTLVQTKDGQHDILRISDGKATTVASFEVAFGSIGSYAAKLAITDQDFWVGINPHAFYRISRKDGGVKHYAMSNEDRWIYSILTSPDQDVWITATLGNPGWSDKHSIAVYLWDHETDSFTTNPYKPAAWADDELSYAMAFKDAKGNILVSYRNKKNESSATLLDAPQQRFDYTPVMSGHELVSGDDFKKGIIFHTPGLRFVEVALRNAVQKNTDIKKTRWMLEQDAQTILMSSGQTLSYQQERWVLHTQAEPPADPDIQIEDAFLKKVNKVVEEHLSESDFEIPQLCQAIQISQSQLHRKIKALTDKSIASYIRTFRLQKGMELLKTKDLSVSEIAYETGFTSPAYFSSAFSKEFGISPSDIRY